MRRALPVVLALALPSVAGCAAPASASVEPAPRRDPPAPLASAPASSVRLPAEAVAHLLFVGDLSLALGVGDSIARHDPGFPFGDVAADIRRADLAIGNLECVVSPLGSPEAPISFRAPPEALDALKDAGFDVVSVANNHALDLGLRAFDDMTARIDASGLGRIGTAAPGRAAPPVLRTVAGVRLAFLGYYEVDWPRAYREVADAKASNDVVIVFNHWGMEDLASPTGAQRTFAHGLVDAGADLVVGAHAHVLQPIETYRDKLVAYGLGNFVFQGTACAPKRAVGGVLEVDVGRGGGGVVAHRLRKVRLDQRGAPHPLADGEALPASAGCR